MKSLDSIFVPYPKIYSETLFPLTYNCICFKHWWCSDENKISITRKLSIMNCVSSFCQLFRMICVILSLIIGSNLVALSFIHKTTALGTLGIILVQNSAFNSSCYLSFSCSLSVTIIRVGKLIQCIQISVISSVITVFHKESSSCFSQSRLLVNLNRCGIAVISPTPITCAVFVLDYFNIWQDHSSFISLCNKRTVRYMDHECLSFVCYVYFGSAAVAFIQASAVTAYHYQ